MSPPPLIRHQRISVRIVSQLIDYLRSQPVGEALYAVGVRLANQPIPLQPDIVYVRAERLDIIQEHYIEGVPDLIVGILSPSHWLYDRREKLQVYQQAGVPEYWIVDPRAETIELYVLEQGSYHLAGQYGSGSVASSVVVISGWIMLRRLASARNLAEETQGICLVSPFLALPDERQRPLPHKATISLAG